MPKWLSPTLLLCALLMAVQFCAAQDAPSENPPPAVAPEPPTQPTAVDAILIQIPEPPAEGTLARDRAQLVVFAYEAGLVRPGWLG